MPSEAISLALAASIYPPALAAIIALGRGTQVRLRVLLLVIAAFFTVLLTGALMLLLFTEVGSSDQTGAHGRLRPATSSAAWRCSGWHSGCATASLTPTRRRTPGPRKPTATWRARAWCCCSACVLYVVPSPIYMGVVKAIADTNASTGQQMLYLVQALLIMLWMIEIPMLLLLLFPARGSQILESINAWFARNGRMAAFVVALVAGVYLIGVGLVEIL